MTEHTPRGQPTRTKLSVTLREAATIAVRCIEELTDKPCCGVTSVLPTTDGWVAGVEVIEDRRIPPTTDILALYEVEIGRGGIVGSYRRIRRYGRGEKDRIGGEEIEEPEDTVDGPPP